MLWAHRCIADPPPGCGVKGPSPVRRAALVEKGGHAFAEIPVSRSERRCLPASSCAEAGLEACRLISAARAGLEPGAVAADSSSRRPALTQDLAGAIPSRRVMASKRSASSSSSYFWWAPTRAWQQETPNARTRNIVHRRVGGW